MIQANCATHEVRWLLTYGKHLVAGDVVSWQWIVQMPGSCLLGDHTSRTCWIMSFRWVTMGSLTRLEGWAGTVTWHTPELLSLRLWEGKGRCVAGITEMDFTGVSPKEWYALRSESAKLFTSFFCNMFSQPSFMFYLLLYETSSLVVPAAQAVMAYFYVEENAMPPLLSKEGLYNSFSKRKWRSMREK